MTVASSLFQEMRVRAKYIAGTHGIVYAGFILKRLCIIIVVMLSG
jgi:hypothetical protein